MWLCSLRILWVDMDQTWKVFSDFRKTDTLKHDEDCLPLYRNLYVMIRSIQKRTIMLSIFVYWNWCFCRSCDYIFVCTYTRVRIHTQTQSTPDVLPKFHFFTVVCGIVLMVTVNQYTVTFWKLRKLAQWQDIHDQIKTYDECFIQ